MNKQKAIKVLTEHNRWRRGEGEYSGEGKVASDPYPQPPYSPAEIGQAMAEAMSDRFSNYLDYLQAMESAPIRIAVTSFGDERPAQAYPDLSKARTAGEWNRIARLNTRLEFKLVPESTPNGVMQTRLGWSSSRW